MSSLFLYVLLPAALRATLVTLALAFFPTAASIPAPMAVIQALLCYDLQVPEPNLKELVGEWEASCMQAFVQDLQAENYTCTNNNSLFTYPAHMR